MRHIHSRTREPMRRPTTTFTSFHDWVESVRTEHDKSRAETKDLAEIEELAEQSEVDALEDDLMAIESPEGRPPDRNIRRAEWRVARILIPAFVFIPAILVTIFAGVVAGIGALFAALVLMCAAAPVWGAGLIRAGEHLHAHEEAEEYYRSH